MDFTNAINEIKLHGVKFPEPFHFKIPEPETSFKNCFIQIYPDFVMIPEYKLIIQWLSDNKGKGLIMTGANGRGKTIVGKFIIPVLLLHFFRRVVTVSDAIEMNNKIDEFLTKKFLYIDDIGVEDQIVRYGERRWAFPELMDNAEKKGNMVIISTNLDANAIEKKYELRTRERIRSMCFAVPFNGESMRK